MIAGGGLAAAKAAEALRAEGFDGAIVLVGREPHLPYERPPLSKGHLQGGDERQKIFVHDADWYRDHAIDLRPGVTVTGVDPAAHQVTLSGGERLRYDKLLLATGAVPRHLTVPGHDRGNVLYLRTVEECDRLRATLSAVGKIVVIGAGWIGLEVAAAARAAGVEVTVVERERQPLLGALGPEIGAVFAGLHRDHGVDLRLGAVLAAVTETGVRLADGAHIEADTVVAGIGAVPDTELAAAAGLTIDNGVKTTADLRTSDPDIFAAGDVANAYHPRLGGHIRVEHWANALNQPAVAARAMLGRQVAYDELPYFYTDQYDLGMEYIGHVPPGTAHDVVIRGDVAERAFLAFWLRDDKVIAAMNVNIWDQGDQLKALVLAAAPIDRAALADPSVALDRLVPAGA
ncbi:NAD(P)/FAD-dependent oxidoreductase [Spongiactinospora rosea]|uniref:NAD(P)/FAD-dependent oxidoreductase n=1 Tax=Spongiactinospora rosea TaxID=2248750 RepID=A0A366LSG1_9ACTN|nr:NAD(P)/FAD-dependent oxidoreductase [Spongiactinospora rosea]